MNCTHLKDYFVTGQKIKYRIATRLNIEREDQR